MGTGQNWVPQSIGWCSYSNLTSGVQVFDFDREVYTNKPWLAGGGVPLTGGIHALPIPRKGPFEIEGTVVAWQTCLWRLTSWVHGAAMDLWWFMDVSGEWYTTCNVPKKCGWFFSGIKIMGSILKTNLNPPNLVDFMWELIASFHDRATLRRCWWISSVSTVLFGSPGPPRGAYDQPWHVGTRTLWVDHGTADITGRGDS